MGRTLDPLPPLRESSSRGAPLVWVCQRAAAGRRKSLSWDEDRSAAGSHAGGTAGDMGQLRLWHRGSPTSSDRARHIHRERKSGKQLLKETREPRRRRDAGH